MDAVGGQKPSSGLAGARTSRTNWRCGGPPTRTWPGSTWATCSASSPARSGFTPPRSGASPIDLRLSTFPTPPCDRRTAWPRRRCMLRRRCLAARCRPPASPTRSCRPATRSAATDEGGVELISHGTAPLVHRADRRPGDLRREPGRQGRRDLGARRQCRGAATGGTRNNRSGPSAGGWSIRRAGTPQGPVASDRRPGRHLRR